ncbi:ribonuclease H-like domain-containing protein, partial [Vibrio parahaemolyticus]|nr:ribonuclease H-like domain-containing protein [Vibrio parahaemolyticus]
NDLVFYQYGQTWAYVHLRATDIVFKRYKDYMRARASHNLMTRNLLKWRRPLPLSHGHWLLRLNVNGAYDPSSGTAACGGIFRDNHHRFVLGFWVKLGECLSIDEAEIWGIYHAMKIARQHSIPISPKIA